MKVNLFSSEKHYKTTQNINSLPGLCCMLLVVVLINSEIELIRIGVLVLFILSIILYFLKFYTDAEIEVLPREIIWRSKKDNIVIHFSKVNQIEFIHIKKSFLEKYCIVRILQTNGQLNDFFIERLLFESQNRRVKLLEEDFRKFDWPIKILS